MSHKNLLDFLTKEDLHFFNKQIRGNQGTIS